MSNEDVLKYLDSLHEKIVRSSFAKNVTENEITALIECKGLMKAKKPNLCMNEKSGMFVDYADGHGEYKVDMNNWWRCPCCNEVVGQRVIAHKHIHDQRKNKYCKNCGQAIDWS